MGISATELIVTLGLMTMSMGAQNPGEMIVSLTEKAAEAEARCVQLSSEPYFEPDMVSGLPWRIYYTWNMKLENRCLDMIFKTVTPDIIRRIYHDMNEYLMDQPAWGAASLLMTMGHANREMLLFDDQGSAGRFMAVPNVMRDGNLSPAKRGVPLLKFQMKLLNHGKFLVIMDCFIGAVSLAARRDWPPNKAEVEGAAISLFKILGQGDYACTGDSQKTELQPQNK